MKARFHFWERKWPSLFAALALLPPGRSFGIDLLVYNNNDSGAGSLRQAIINNNLLDGNNTIIFSNAVTGTITLTSGELFISNNVTVLGPGASVLTVSGNAAHRVFHITNSVVAISGLTIANGLVGGATPPTNSGAGIYNDHATLALSNCAVSTSRAATYGGGIYSDGPATLTIVGCTIDDNQADFAGGGIASGGTLTLISSTVHDNLVTNSVCRGAGIFLNSGSLSATNSTIVGNISAHSGGGVARNLGTATLRNCLIADNFADMNGPDCLGGFTSAGYNLIGDTTGSTGFGAIGDQLNVDPLLGGLVDDGPTETFSLLVGSPAIDQGHSSGIPTDQRGQPRYDDPNIANAPGGDGADIGAYEAAQLRFTGAQKSGNNLRLDFVTWLGTNYGIQSRSNLTTGLWVSLPGKTIGNGGIASTTVSNAFNQPQQFYRVQAVP